ncbi:MAG TPA: phenylalanine--tRNA ligase beta subunit-related protein [Thermomicrobiales bacterium]|nr:phenylalanine--tRNA ligase beta subunit-related protein [Thermomicrobiales bacterium]
MEFVVEPAIFERFPGLRLAVVVAHGVDNRADRPAAAARWRDAWDAAGREGAQYGNAQSHPRVRRWRERFRAQGISGKEFPSSAEALLRRALKGGEPFAINPLVDFYNSVSLRHAVPAGGFDLDHVAGPLELRLTRPGDHFTALDEDAPLPVPPGEVAYADGQTVLTRHFVWRQARTALITPATRSVFLVSEILGEVGPDVADAVLADLRDGLATLFDITPTYAAVLDADNPSAAT